MPKNIIDKTLEEKYTSLIKPYFNFSDRKARKAIRQAIKSTKKEILTKSNSLYRDEYGDTMFELAQDGVEVMKTQIQIARDEGVSDQEIRDYWNMSELERGMIFWFENVIRTMCFKQAKDEGLSSEEAGKRVRKNYPIYGNPKETRPFYESSDDNPLPNELRTRVEKFRFDYSPEDLLKNAEKHSSFNAFIREEMRKGKL